MTKFEALKKGPVSEFWGNKIPKCPHCGFNMDPSHHDNYEIYNDNDVHWVTCPECNEDYQVTTYCSYSFSTDEQDDMDDDE